MIITAIERTPRRRARVTVYLDGTQSIEITRATARKRELRPGTVVDQSTIDEIVSADRRRVALDAAAALLARRPRSERELRRRLTMRKLEPPLVDETIERLRALKLIDDAAFARSWAESRDRSAPRGKRLVVQELRAFGVDAEIARVAAEDLSDSDGAYRLACRRVRTLSGLDARAFRERLSAFLVRRGFDWEVARATAERCWRESGGAENGAFEFIE